MLLVGCGYVGTRLARQYLDLGQPVIGVVRSAAGVVRLKESGIPALAADLSQDDLSRLPLRGSRVFLLAPPPASGTEDLHTRRLTDAFKQAGTPRRVVYISTTGVYGDCGGAWVDETWPARPAVDRARRRWDAEQTLTSWSRKTGGS